MADAIKSVRPDLSNFYASLSDEQKAKFNTMGPPPNATSSTAASEWRSAIAERLWNSLGYRAAGCCGLGDGTTLGAGGPKAKIC
jgi:hypothetical protein